MRITYKASAPPLQSDSYAERWGGPDNGVICSWLRGLELRRESPELAQRALAGELPVLALKGGVAKALRSGHKIGAIQYLATWHGLRSEDLDLETTAEPQLTCTRTGVTVTFTAAMDKLWSAGAQAAE